MDSQRLLLRIAGILGLVGAGLAFGGLLLPIGSWGYTAYEVVAGLAAVLAAVGGVLAVVGNRVIAPWLLVGAFVGDLVGRLLVAPAVYDGWVAWPGRDLINVADNLQFYGARFGAALFLSDLATFVVLAAAIVGVIAFFASIEAASSRSAAHSGADKPPPSGHPATQGASMSVSAGWYPDPQGLPCDRYWDGQAWSQQTRPSTARQAAPLTAATALTNAQVAPANGMGTAALVMGILGILVLPVVFSILAIIFGSVGVGRANRGLATNKGAATAGLILGILGILLGILVGVWLSSS